MSPALRSLVLVLAIGLGYAAAVGADDKKPYTGAGCAAEPDAQFRDEVWAKVGVRKCLTCHKAGGDAEDSKFVLRDPRKSEGDAPATRRCGTTATPSPAWRGVKEKDQSRLLLKVVGELDHGGEDVAEGRLGRLPHPRRVRPPGERPQDGDRPIAIDPKAPPFFDGVVMLDDRRLLRRVTLSLAGRLPTDAELAAVAQGRR